LLNILVSMTYRPPSAQDLAPPQAAHPPSPVAASPAGAPWRPKAIFALDAASVDLIYGPEERGELARLAEFHAAPQTRDSLQADPAPLAETEVIFSGWGAPPMDAAFLEKAPRLRAVFYGAGSIRYFTSDAFWRRGVVVTSAYAANAVPVAEYVLGTILLSLKNFWAFAAGTRHGQGWDDHTRSVLGNFRTTVGLVSFGMVARKVRELLRPFDLRVLVYCPFLTAAEAATLGVEQCSLEEIFERADVVSLHTPDLPQTRGMVTGRHFSRMKPGASFINTARGAVVNQPEMVEALRARPDLTAVLDVSNPEPAPVGDPLLTLPNVVLTPHIAGSLGPECRRMGHYMVEEFRRYLAGEPLQWQITEALAARLA